MSIWKRICEWLGISKVPKKPPEIIVHPHKARRKVDISAIRARIASQGWSLKELPIRRNSPDSVDRKVMQWKIIAFRGERSIETGGATIDEAIKNIGVTLGVISKDVTIS